MKKRTRSQGTTWTIIKQLKPLRVEDAGELRVSVVERAGKRWLDIRYFMKTDKYTGPTQKGIRLSIEEVEVLFSKHKKISKLLRA